MERRTFFRNSAGIAAAAVGLAVAPAASNAVPAEAGTENQTDPFPFVTDDMTTDQVAEALFESAPEEREAYVALAESKFGDLSPREQLSEIAAEGNGLSGAKDAQGSEVTPMAAPLVPAAVFAARILIAAAKRYGPAAFRALKSAVSKGYQATNTFINNHAWASAALGAVAGVSATELWEALKSLL